MPPDDRSIASAPDDALDVLWFCQLAADGEFLGSSPHRKPTLPYLAGLVETAAEMGFSSLLTATNFHAEHDAWAGVGLARTGVGVAIVGDAAQVEAKLRAHQALGISTCILSGYPHLEECRRFGELVMPRLRVKLTSAVINTLSGAGVAPVT